LEDEGYIVQAYVLPAASVNAPHRRDRVWFVAYSDSAGFQAKGAEQQATGVKQYGELGRNATNTESKRIQGHRTNGEQESQAHARPEISMRRGSGGGWDNWPTEPPIRGMDDGVPNRVDRIKALVNAIVPQVALQIFKTIDEYEKLTL